MVVMRRGRSSATCEIKDREVYSDMAVFLFPLSRMTNYRRSSPRRAETRAPSPPSSASSSVAMDNLLSRLQVLRLADRPFRLTLEVDGASTPIILSVANGRVYSSESSISSSTSRRRAPEPVRRYGMPLDGDTLPGGARSFIVKASSHPGQYLHSSEVQRR